MSRVSRYALYMLMQTLAVIAMLATAAASPAAKAVNIDGERFSAPSAVLHAGPTGENEPYCGAQQQGSVQFSAEGTASGPYPGTFTETGQWDFDLITEQTFHSQFTIKSGTRTITGMISYEAGGAGAEGKSFIQNWGGCTWSQSGGPYTYCPSEAFAGVCSGQSVAFISAEGLTQIFEHPTGSYHMEILEGNEQSAPVNTWFETPLTVRVTDSLGAPVAGVLVRYLPASKKGPSAAPQGPWTGTYWDGTAQMKVQASPFAGTYGMVAKGEKGAAATFTLTNTP